MVTAQRRPELAREVPISLTVRSEEQLDRLQITDTDALEKTVPSLVMTRSGAFTQPFLRGVGKRSTLGVENSVATYVDGVYLASSISALLDLHGIERVEVLNGPQGTLFGRNTSGGVIQIVTRDPGATPAADVEVEAGSYGNLRADAYVSGGSDRFAGNVAVSLSRNGGYGVNLFTGEKDQGEVGHSLVARSKWIWNASDAVALVLAADYQDIDHDFSQRPLDGYPPAGEPRVLGFRDGDQNASNHFHFRYGGASLRAEAGIGSLTVISISAARRMQARYNADLDQGPLPLLSAHPIADQKQLSQEFQLSSSEGARIAWTAGLYFIRLEEQYEPTLFVYGGSYSARIGGRLLQALSDIGRVSSYAGYGQATYSLDQATRLTAGLRYTVEDRSVEARGRQEFGVAPFIRPIPNVPLETQPALHDDDRFSEFTWRASLDRDLSDTTMGYVSVSRGFQSGGWNLQTPQAPAFAPETLDAAEGGIKYSSRSGAWSADASAFYYDYANLQVSAFTPLGSMTTNATSAEIYGLEAQLAVRIGRTAVTAGAQLLEAHYGSFPNATCINLSPAAPVPYAPVACDASGNRLPFAPSLKANLGADHEFRLGAGGNLVLSGNLAFNSGYYAEADNIARQDSFATFDLMLEWRPGGPWPSLRLWVRNLTDAQYFDSLANFPTTGILQRPAPPRRFGASIAYRL